MLHDIIGRVPDATPKNNDADSADKREQNRIVTQLAAGMFGEMTRKGDDAHRI